MSERLPPESSVASGSSEGDGGTGQPVTTVVRRHVRPECRAAYEGWLRRLLADADGLPGYLGADIHPPRADDDQATYTSVFRFATLEQLRSFERSELWRRYLDEVADYVEADAVWDTHTGLELWFSPPTGTIVSQPVRWRMAVILGTVVYVLVLIFGAVADVTIGNLAPPLRLAIVIAVEMTLMTYLILPWVTRRLARWIFPRTSRV